MVELGVPPAIIRAPVSFGEGDLGVRRGASRSRPVPEFVEDGARFGGNLGVRVARQLNQGVAHFPGLARELAI